MTDPGRHEPTRHATEAADVLDGQLPLWPAGPWDEAGNLRLPPAIEQAGPMPPGWPVVMLWAAVGRDELAHAPDPDAPDTRG